MTNICSPRRKLEAKFPRPSLFWRLLERNPTAAALRSCAERSIRRLQAWALEFLQAKRIRLAAVHEDGTPRTCPECAGPVHWSISASNRDMMSARHSRSALYVPGDRVQIPPGRRRARALPYPAAVSGRRPHEMPSLAPGKGRGLAMSEDAKQCVMLCSPFHETDSARSNWLRSLRYCNGDLNPSAEWGAAAL